MRFVSLKTFPLFIFLLAISIGCTTKCRQSREEMTAEQVVEAYLDLAFNMESLDQKETLMELTTGSLRTAIAGATDDTIETAYIHQRYKLERYSIVSRRDRTPKETEITYQILYKELPEGTKDFALAQTVTTENTVAVVKENKRWYIRDVLGNKSTIDFPISDDSKITPEPAP